MMKKRNNYNKLKQVNKFKKILVLMKMKTKIMKIKSKKMRKKKRRKNIKNKIIRITKNLPK